MNKCCTDLTTNFCGECGSRLPGTIESLLGFLRAKLKNAELTRLRAKGADDAIKQLTELGY